MMYGQMTAGSWIYIGTQEVSRGPTKHLPRPDASTTAVIFRDGLSSLLVLVEWGALSLAILWLEPYSSISKSIPRAPKT